MKTPSIKGGVSRSHGFSRLGWLGVLVAALSIGAARVEAGPPLYTFPPPGNAAVNIAEGGSPQAPLIFGPDGNLYGTTSVGGTNGYGTIFTEPILSPA
jgi:hypothetical protein